MSLARFAHRHLAHSAIVLVLAVSLAACGSDNQPTEPANVAGTYVLSTIDGSPLPDTLPDSEHHVVITGATIQINSNHTYQVTGAGSADGEDDDDIVADVGTYEQLGDHTIAFTSTAHAGITLPGVVDNGTLTINVPGEFLGSEHFEIELVFHEGASPL